MDVLRGPGAGRRASLMLNASLVKKVSLSRKVLVSSTSLSFVVTFGVELAALR